MNMSTQERTALVEKFIPFCWKEGLRAYHRGYGKKLGDPEDCFSHAVLALYHAIDLFDSCRGVKFITYATRSVRLYLMNLSEEETSLIRTPRKGSFDSYPKHLQPKITAARAVHHFGEDEAEKTILGPEREWYTDETSNPKLQDALKKLTPLQRKAIHLYYYRGLTGKRWYARMGRKNGASNHLRRAALDNLRRLLKEESPTEGEKQ